MTHRFEVDYKQRLEQRKNATNAVRLPRLGYELYRVYDIEPQSHYEQQTHTMTLNKNRGMSTGPVSVVSAGRSTGKSTFLQYLLYDTMYSALTKEQPVPEKPHTVKWLKPKHVTLLRMKGHTVEPAQLGDKPGRVNPPPMRLGR